MKISTKSRYGTRAILEIALNQNEDKLTRKQISQNQDIPMSYLENILITLKSKGIIRTIRGPKGGYELAVKPDDITILQIVEIMEGTSDSMPCFNNDDNCSRSSRCVTKGVWEKLQRAQEKVLKGITIKDLVDQTHEQYNLTYSI